MSVLDDILGFFRDLSTRSNQQQADDRTLKDEDVPIIVRVLKSGLNIPLLAQQGVFGEGAAEFVKGVQAVLDEQMTTVDKLRESLLEQVLLALEPILNLPLVERPTGLPQGVGGTAEFELEIGNALGNEAARGAVLATGLVMGLNYLAFALDAGVQAVTLGQARGFQELVQNVIWAAGLSDLGGLSFRPQIAASFAPLLERRYNAMAQAQIPGTGDLIRFLVREVFDPQRRSDLEADKTSDTLRAFMRQRGFSDFWSDSYWAAHWQLLSTSQLNEAVHRGVINSKEWERQVRLNDVVPEGIPWLQQTIYSPFTRVDVRRMGDLGVLDDEQLLQAYADIGYYALQDVPPDGDGKAKFAPAGTFDASVHKAEALVKFTRVYNALPSIRRRLSNGFITPLDARRELVEIGLPDNAVERIWQTLVKAVDVGEAEPIKAMTTAQIVRGAKNGLISFGQGQFLLEELGWSSARAEFMLRLQVAPEDAPTATQLGDRLISRE